MRKLKTIEMQRLSVEEFKAAQKLPLVVVLDDVRSLYNVGSLFRTADAFRVEAIYLCGITATPPHPEIHKTALGAEDAVRWRYFSSAEEAVENLKKEGRTVYAIEQAEGSTMLQELFKGPLPTSPFRGGACQHSPEGGDGGCLHCAIVLGNEVKGVKQEVVDRCDGCIELPQLGTKHSLNVSVAGALTIWEFAKNMLIR